MILCRDTYLQLQQNILIYEHVVSQLHTDQGMISAMMILDPSDHSWADDGWEGDDNAGVDPETQISSFAKTENSSQRRTATFVSFAVLTLIIGMVV